MLFHWDPPTSSTCIFSPVFFLILCQFKWREISSFWFCDWINFWRWSIFGSIISFHCLLSWPYLSSTCEHPGLWFPTSSWIASIQRTLLDQHSTVLNLDLGVHCHGRVGENQEPRGCKNHLTGDKFFKTINTSLICKPRECSRVSTGAEILLRMQMISNTLTLKK